MIERALDGRGCNFKVLISSCVHSLVCSDAQNSDLVELAHDEHSDPHEVKHTVEKHPEHPRRAGGDLRDVVPKAIFSVAGNTVNTPVANASIYHPTDHTQQEE